MTANDDIRKENCVIIVIGTSHKAGFVARALAEHSMRILTLAKHYKTSVSFELDITDQN